MGGEWVSVSAVSELSFVNEFFSVLELCSG